MQTQARLTVDVTRLAKTGERLTGELDGAVLDLGNTAGLIEPASGICYDLRVEPIDSELLVRGSVSATVACICSRCAGRFETPIKESFFVASYPLEETTDIVDLTADLREAIILLLSGYPVCQEGCRGLCPRCGTNLNEASCRCKSEDADGRWNALDVISLSRERTKGAQSGRSAGCDASKRNHVNGSKRSVSNGGTETEEI